VVPGTALRVRLVVSRTAAVAPCGDYAEGETEEYTLRVVRPELDAQPAALAFPEADPCPHPAVPVAVTLRNVGAGPLADVPVQVVVKGETGPAQTLTGVLSGGLAPFAEGKVTLNGTFAARAGERYTFVVTTRAPGDVNRANDTLSFIRTVGQPGSAPVATATACAADSVQLQSGGAGVTYWYDAPAGGNLVGVGNRTSTAVRTTNLAYYAATDEFAGRLGPARKNFAAGGGYGPFTPAVRLTTQVPLVIERVRLYVGQGGTVTFTVETPAGVPVASRTIAVTPTRSPAGAGILPDDPVDTGRVYLLQLPVPRPGNYQISVSYGNGATLFRNNDGVAGYPFAIPGVAAITGNSAASNPESFYYYLYDVEVKAYGCPGPRVAVVTNRIDAPAPTAVLAGGGTVCEGDTAQLTVQLGGTPPWNLTYTDGTRTTEVTGITDSSWRLLTTQGGHLRHYGPLRREELPGVPVHRSGNRRPAAQAPGHHPGGGLPPHGQRRGGLRVVPERGAHVYQQRSPTGGVAGRAVPRGGYLRQRLQIPVGRNCRRPGGNTGDGRTADKALAQPHGWSLLPQRDAAAAAHQPDTTAQPAGANAGDLAVRRPHPAPVDFAQHRWVQQRHLPAGGRGAKRGLHVQTAEAIVFFLKNYPRNVCSKVTFNIFPILMHSKSH
jgi:hypothetical protein